MYQSQYNNVVDRANTMNLGAQDYAFNAGSSAVAKLYLFTPRQLPVQVLRPHAYSFSDRFIDSIQDTSTHMQLLPNIFNQPEGPVIAPTSTGIPLDLNAINSCYSFVLIIDTKPNARLGGMLSTLAETRQILIGFVASSDEPYNRLTNTINPNAVLNFTHASTVRLTNSFGSTGGEKNIHVANYTDYVNELTGQQTNNDMFLAAPGELVSANIGDTGEVLDAANICVSNARFGEDSMSIDGTLKSPVCHMSKLCSALEDSVTQASALNSTHDIMSVDSGLDQYGSAKSYFKNNVPNTNAITPMQGFNPNRPITIGNLDLMFGGSLVVKTYEVPTTSQWDVYPQDLCTTKNAMSSFASMTISAVATACALAHVVFRYASWTKDTFMGNTSGTWNIMGCSTLVDVPDPNKQLNMLNKFKQMLEIQLFPTLLQVYGDFDLMCYVNVGGEVLVDLNFLDMNPSYQGVGFFETNTRLGGMLNPLLADRATLANNAININKLANTYIDKEFGMRMTSMPYSGNQVI